MIDKIKLYLEQQNELILRDKKYLIRFFRTNNGLYFTFVLHLSDRAHKVVSSIEFGMNKLDNGSIQFQNKSIKSLEFKTFNELINKLNQIELLEETHEKILKKVLKFMKENNLTKKEIKNSVEIGI